MPTVDSVIDEETEVVFRQHPLRNAQTGLDDGFSPLSGDSDSAPSQDTPRPRARAARGSFVDHHDGVDSLIDDMFFEVRMELNCFYCVRLLSIPVL
jgi:hypothetical protein